MSQPSDRPKFLLRRADRERLPEESSRHPMNPNSQIHGWSLSDLCGLKRVGLHQIRIPPGKESFIFHSHQLEEEFMYVLSGQGELEAGDGKYEVGPGDFVGFATPSIGHLLKNTGSEDLVYLSGGERREVEVADFPRQGKRMVRVGREVTIYSTEGAQTMQVPSKEEL